MNDYLFAIAFKRFHKGYAWLTAEKVTHDMADLFGLLLMPGYNFPVRYDQIHSYFPLC